MYTEKHFYQLTQKAINDENLPNESLETSSSFTLEPASLARVIALSEVLGLTRTTLLNELLECALGDAHDGFLSAYEDVEEQKVANEKLKSRVRALLTAE